MGNTHTATATRPPVPVYRVDLALIARLHAAHAASAAHQQAQAWAQVARERLDACERRRRAA